MAAAAEFSIRGYAASMKAAAGVEARRPFGIVDLPPMESPSFRWWADEQAFAVAAAALSPSPSPRRSLGKARTPKKRSISDLFAAAPPTAVAPADSSGGSEYPDVDDDDEALCAIVMRAKEEKRRKRKLQEEAVSAAAAEGSGRREPEGNFATRKGALDKPNLPDGLDTQASNKPEGVQLLGKEKEKITDIKRRKQGKINNIQKKGDSPNYIESKKASKVGKPRDLGKMLPLHSILKKYTKHTSVKMVKEKHGSSKGTEVIEFRRKSVKRVKFSEVNDVLGSKTQSCKLPKQQSLHKLLSDAMASSSWSSSSSSSFTGMSGEGDKCITAESSSSHRPEEALTQNKEANQNTEHEDFPELPLIDLNKALPESADLDYTYDSNSEVPNVGHTHEETLNSGVQVLDGRENQRDQSSDSYALRCQQPATDLETVQNSRPAGTLLHSEATEGSDIDIVRPRLSLRELAETNRDCNSALVKDTRSTWMSPCALPHRTVQDTFQHYQNGFSTNLNHGGSQLSTGGDTSSLRSRECNLSHSEKPHFHSGLNVRNECRPPTEQIVRLMGKDLTVSTSRGECSAEMAEKHVGTPSFKDHLKRNVFLELPQGQSFVSLHGQGFPNVSVTPTSASPVSTYSPSTRQTHFGYRTPHDSRHPLPAANAFSGDRSPYEHRFIDFSNLPPNQHLQVGCPPLPNHGSAAFHQNSLPPWRYYSDPFTRTEPATAPFLLASRHHGTSSSVPHGSFPQPYSVHPASSSVHPHNSASFMFSHPGRIDQVVSGMRRDAALPSRNVDSILGRAVPENVRRDAAHPSRNSDIRTVGAVPDSSNASSSGQHVQKRPGPVKLTPGAKHILVPSDAAGENNSVPVYSRVSFGGRSGNASSSQNKGAR